MKNIKQPESEGHGVALGLGVAAAVAAAAGAYFLYGSKKGPARRKALKTWMVKMKGEVMEELEKMENISEGKYHEVIDRVSKKYEALKNIDQKELQTTIKRLKGHWKDIKKEIKA